MKNRHLWTGLLICSFLMVFPGCGVKPSKRRQEEDAVAAQVAKEQEEALKKKKSQPATNAPDKAPPPIEKNTAGPPNLTGFSSPESRKKLLDSVFEFEETAPAPEFATTPSGLKYRILKQGNGKKSTAPTTDRVLLACLGTLNGGKIFERKDYGTSGNRFPANRFAATMKYDTTIAGFREGVQLVDEEGIIDLEIPPSLGYGNQPHPEIPPGSTLHFVIKLFQVNPPTYMEWLSDLAKKEGYTKSTDNALHYKIIKQTEGIRPTFADKVQIHLIMEIIEQKTITNTYNLGEPQTLYVSNMIPGVAQGVRMIGEGGIIELLIPPSLGFRVSSDKEENVVPPLSLLHCKLELLKVHVNPKLNLRKGKPSTATEPTKPETKASPAPKDGSSPLKPGEPTTTPAPPQK